MGNMCKNLHTSKIDMSYILAREGSLRYALPKVLVNEKISI